MEKNASSGSAELPVKKEATVNRLQFLDALRGLAAIDVVVVHLVTMPDPDLVPARWAERLTQVGSAGVVLFFTLSAFSLYYTMPARARDPKPHLHFFLLRFFRIAPLFYFVLAMSLVRDAWAFGVLHPPGEVLASVFFVYNFIPDWQTGIAWASWTIGVEVVFYAAFPLIYRYVRTLGHAIALYFGSLAAWTVLQVVLPKLGAAHMVSQFSILNHFPTFAIGILLFFVYSAIKKRDLPESKQQAMGVACIAVGVYCGVTMLHGNGAGTVGDYRWLIAGAALFFLGLALFPWRLLVNRFTAYIGKIGFSVYLLHATVIYFLYPVTGWIFDTFPHVVLSMAASALLVFAIVLPLSVATYKLIEEPGIELGRRVAIALKARRPDTVSMWPRAGATVPAAPGTPVGADLDGAEAPVTAAHLRAMT